MGEDFKIGLAEKGYKSVKLKCSANHMILTIETDEDFSGVIYTRGSFYDKNYPCFLNTANSQSKRNFTMKFNLRECNTKKVSVFSLIIDVLYGILFLEKG